MEFEELEFDDELEDSTAEETVSGETTGSAAEETAGENAAEAAVTEEIPGEEAAEAEEAIEELRLDAKPEEAVPEDRGAEPAAEESAAEEGPAETSVEETETAEAEETIEELELDTQPEESVPEDISAGSDAEETVPRGEIKPMFEPPAEEVPETGGGIVKPVLMGLFFAVLLAAAYVWGIDYYGTHFLPNTLIDGIDVGELTAEEAKDKLATAYDDHIFRFTGRDGAVEDLDISEASPERDYEGIQGVLSAQDRKSWIFSRKPLKESPLTFHGTFDEEGLQRALDKSVLLDPARSIPPEDAYMTFDGEDGHYVIIPEVNGTTVNREAVVPVMEEILRKGGSSLDLEEIGSYVPPEIFSDNEELNRQTNVLNTLQDLHAGVDMGADVIEPLNGEQLLELITKEGAAEAYVTGLRDRYDTYNTEEKRLFQMQDGNYKLISAAWGWRMDEEKTLEAVHAMVNEAAKTIGLAPPAEEEGENTESAPAAETAEGEEAPNPYLVEANWKNKAVVHDRRLDYGNTYAEVDLTHQTVYVIRDGEVVFTSPCVSGRMTKGRITPEGFYDIKLKQTNKVLVGYKPDGSVDYRSPVSYWMPFNGGIGFHDATWRGSFGGTIYIYSGSHGCINLPYSRAKEMYDLVYKGMPVICYY